jgi:hypothetical protein
MIKFKLGLGVIHIGVVFAEENFFSNECNMVVRDTFVNLQIFRFLNQDKYM